MKILLVIYCMLSLCAGYNILIPLAYTYGSVSKFFYSLSIKLVERGHSVTFITPFGSRNKHANLDLVVLDERAKPAEMDPWRLRNEPSILNEDTVAGVINASKVFCQDKRIRKLWTERNKFDMIITDSYFNEIVHVFMYDFKGATAQVCSAGLEYECLNRLGNKISPSFLPVVHSLLTEHMNFFERIVNIYNYYVYGFLINRGIAQNLATKYYPEVGDIMRFHYTLDLTLINSHYVMDYPVPLLPNQVEIGCLDCKHPKSLRKDLKSFVEDSGDAGIIYFSLGTIAKTKQFPKNTIEAFIEAFRRLPQRVIMKIGSPPTNLPNNIFTSDWLPQIDILAHPKTKVFVSHCGIQSSQEAKYHGIPVLAIPIFVDQPKVARFMEKAGQAIVLQWETITAELIVETINKLVNSTQYIDNMRRVSNAMQDQKETAAERGIWWIEHVIRQRGSKTMEFPGKRLNFFQYYLHDILFFFLISIFSILLIFTIICLKCTVYRNKANFTITKEKLKTK